MARFDWQTMRRGWQAVRRPDWKAMKRPLMLTLGYTFLVLGVLGTFLPILQGFLFLAIGLAILARYAAWARLLRMRIARRYPRVGAKINEAERTAQRWLRRAGEKWRGLVSEMRVRGRLWRWQLKETWSRTEARLQCWLRRMTGQVRR